MIIGLDELQAKVASENAALVDGYGYEMIEVAEAMKQVLNADRLVQYRGLAVNGDLHDSTSVKTEDVFRVFDRNILQEVLEGASQYWR